MKRVLPLTLMFSVSAARADILFLDLNNAELEYQAAVTAAEARGEKVIRLPRVNETDRKRHDKGVKAIDDLANRINKSCGDENTNSSLAAKCDQMRSQYDSQTAAFREKEKIKPLQGQDITAELKRLHARGVDVSSVVISGHDGNGRFKGIYANLSSQAFEAAFAAAPEASRNIRSLFLWGCYTTSLGAVDGYWKKSLPSAGLFVGYDGRGYSKYQQPGVEYLRDALKYDQELMTAHDENTLRGVFTKIEGFNELGSGASICNMVGKSGGWVAHTDLKDPSQPLSPENQIIKIESIEEIRRKCAIPDDKIEQFKTFKKYLEAREPEFANPPSKTHDGTPLRDFYDFVSKREYHCRDYWEDVYPDLVFPTGDQARNLLFYNMLKLNFGRLHKKEMQKLDQLLEEVGLPEPLRVSDLPKLSRKAIKERLTAIDGYLQDVQVDSLREVQIEMARQSVNQVSGILSEMDRTPNDWYEATAEEKSQTFINSLSDQRSDAIGTDLAYGRLKLEMNGKIVGYSKDSGSVDYTPQIKAAREKLKQADENGKAQALAELKQWVQKQSNPGSGGTQSAKERVKSELQTEIEKREREGWDSKYQKKAYLKYLNSL